MKDDHFQYSNSILLQPLLFVVGLWVVFWIQVRYDFDFYAHGILPRTFSGLQGVVLSPFIHSDIAHLYNNSIPLLVLMMALQYFYRQQASRVLVLGVLISGFFTWIIGRDNYHIGASGLIYVLVSFIFFKGIQTKYYRLVALSLTIILLYGGLIWYAFPDVEDSISWEGHLSGLIAGFIMSLFYALPSYKKQPNYDWEQPNYNASEDKFMQRFDENGNFVNLPEPEPEILDITDNFDSEIANPKVVYEFIESKKKN